MTRPSAFRVRSTGVASCGNDVTTGAMSGVGQNAYHQGSRDEAPILLHETMAPSAEVESEPEFSPLPAGQGWGAIALKTAFFAGFVWLALSVAAIYLLVDTQAARRLDLVEWAAVVAFVSTPLALIGVFAALVLRVEASRSGTLVGHAQALFDRASIEMRGEIAHLTQALAAMRGEILAQRTEVDTQTQKLLAAGDGLSRQTSAVVGQLSAEAATLTALSASIDQSAANTRIDLGVILADLPRAEALVESLRQRLNEVGAEANAQTAVLETALGSLNHHTASAKESATAAAHILAAQAGQIDNSAERIHSHVEELTGRLDHSIDSALLRMANALETARSSIAVQNDAVAAAIDAAGSTLIGTSDNAARRINETAEQLEGRLQGFDALLDKQDGRVHGLLAYLGEKLIELEGQLGSLGRAGEAQSQLLSDAVSGLQQTVEGLTDPLATNDERVTRLIERVSIVRQAVAEIDASIGADIPAKLADADAAASQARATLAEAQSSFDEMEQRLSRILGSIESIRTVSADGVDRLEHGLSTALERMETLTGQLESGRAQIEAIATDSEDVGFKASTTLLDAISRARETATQASDHIRSVLTGVVEEAKTALAGANEEALKSAVDEAIGARIATLRSTSEEAVGAAQAAAERLARQMLTITDTTASIEARISEVNAQVEEQNQEEFSRRSALLIESLNSAAIDIAKVMTNEVSDVAWAAYLKGDRSVFARRAVRLIDGGEAKAIQRHYEQEDDFREQVNRYVHDFEAIIRRVLAERDGGPMAVAMLSSDVGKLYVVLAQSIERLRNG